jgi:hypothetical protein
VTAKTSEHLAKVLESVGLDKMAARAREDMYHDFLSELDSPGLTLEAELRNAVAACPDKERAAKIEDIRQRHIQDGEFDASPEESEEWAESPEGQATFARLVEEREPKQTKHTLGDAPIEPEYYDKMNALARGIDKVFNGEVKGKGRKTGFVLMAFAFGDNPSRCNFISNGVDRRDVVTLMKEMIARFEGQPELKGRA